MVTVRELRAQQNNRLHGGHSARSPVPEGYVAGDELPR